jgi:aminopeptidase-like protein
MYYTYIYNKYYIYTQIYYVYITKQFCEPNANLKTLMLNSSFYHVFKPKSNNKVKLAYMLIIKKKSINSIY